MSELGDFLHSINYSKEDLIRCTDSPTAAEKLYPLFPVARTLSYFPDTIFLVNEINIRGRREFEVTPSMHYEFLLNLVPKKKRFSRWARPAKDEYTDLLVRKYECSKEEARSYLAFYSEEQLQQLQEEFDEGGKQ